MGKNILIIGHAFVIDENRAIWSKLAHMSDLHVDVLIPKKWKSNLVGNVQSSTKEGIGIRNLFTLDTYFSGNGSLYFYHLWQTLKVFRKHKYDYILINQESWSLSLLFINLIRLLSLNLNSKTFLMIAQNIKKKKLRWIIPLEKFNLLFVDTLLGCCRETESVFRWKGISKKWKYFPLFYSDKIINDPKYYEKKNEVIRIGYIGRISKEKGIETLLEAYNILKNKYKVELVFAGTGDVLDQIDLPGVEYLGVLAHDKVNEFYSKVDIVVLPSLTKEFWKEQFGRVIVEAIASGRLILGSDSGAIPEVMGELGLDFIFQENNTQSLVNCFEYFYEKLQKNDLVSIYKEAQEKNIRKFSGEAFVQRLLEYLDE